MCMERIRISTVCTEYVMCRAGHGMAWQAGEAGGVRRWRESIDGASKTVTARGKQKRMRVHSKRRGSVQFRSVQYA